MAHYTLRVWCVCVCVCVCAHFCSLVRNVPRCFFIVTHQVKTITIGISRDNPLAEIS